MALARHNNRYIFGKGIQAASSEKRDTEVSEESGYKSTMWGIISFLLVLVLALALLLFLVVQHYRFANTFCSLTNITGLLINLVLNNSVGSTIYNRVDDIITDIIILL